MQQRKKGLFVLGFACSIGAILLIAFLCRPATLVFSMEPLQATPATQMIHISDADFAGLYKNANGSETGLYFSKESDYLEILYTPLSGGDVVEVYKSKLPIVAYQTYALDRSMLVLELFIDTDQKLSFCLTRVGYGNQFDRIETLFYDECDRMPYLSVADLYTEYSPRQGTAGKERLEARSILNYDKNGESRLILLNKYASRIGTENVLVASGEYNYSTDGYLGSGKRIVFCGGYGEHIYYQALYNRIGDPHPEVANFESTGTPVLFRYSIRDESVERILELDKIALHINGNDKIAIVSEYDYDVPLQNSGKIFFTENKTTSFTIPGIESGDDIQGSRFISENQFALYSHSTLYLFDMEQAKGYLYTLKNLQGIQLGEDGISFVQSQQNGLHYNFIQYDDVFA